MVASVSLQFNAVQIVAKPFYHKVFDWLVAPSRFPVVTDTWAEQGKLDFIRLLTGLVVLYRAGLIVYASVYYYDPVPGFGMFLHPEFALGSILMLVLLLWTVGFMTPLATLGLLIVYPLFDNLFCSGTLGTNVLQLMLLVFLVTGAGKRYSIDSLLLHAEKSNWLSACIHKLYLVWRMPNTLQFTLYYFIAFVLYSLLHLGALTYHFSDPYWVSGNTVAVMLTNSYFSRLYEFFRWLEHAFPLPYQYHSYVVVIVQSIFQGLAIPLIYFKWGKRFVVTWGLVFFFMSWTLLQLSYLAPVEFLFWGILFLPAAGRDQVAIIYDNQCNMCQGTMRVFRFLDPLNCFEFKPLTQNKSLATQFNVDTDTLYRSMHGIYQNKIYEGYDLYLLCSKTNPLLWLFYPVLFLFRAGGIGPKTYQWVAAKRYAWSQTCKPTQQDLPIEKPEFKPVFSWVGSSITAIGLLLMVALVMVFPMFDSIGGRDLFRARRITGRVIYKIGLVIPYVFNDSDLSTGDKWPVLVRINQNGSRERVPLNFSDGARDWYHRFDILYFGNSLTWRRASIKANPFIYNTPGHQGFDRLMKVLNFDYRLHDRKPVAYEVTIYQNQASKIDVSDLNQRYIATPILSFQIKSDNPLFMSPIRFCRGVH